MLKNISIESAKVIESRINGNFDVLETISNRSEIRDLNVSIQDKAEIFKEEAKRTGFTSIGIGDLNRDAYTMTLVHIVLKDRPYYQEALKGNRVVTDPIISKYIGSLIINMAVPVKDKDGKVIGVLVGSRDAGEISNIISDITVGKTGKSFISEKVENTSAVPEEVSASSEEIAASTEEMKTASSEVSASEEILNTMTHEMIEHVGKFKI